MIKPNASKYQNWILSRVYLAAVHATVSGSVVNTHWICHKRKKQMVLSSLSLSSFVSFGHPNEVHLFRVCSISCRRKHWNFKDIPASSRVQKRRKRKVLKNHSFSFFDSLPHAHYLFLGQSLLCEALFSGFLSHWVDTSTIVCTCRLSTIVFSHIRPNSYNEHTLHCSLLNWIELNCIDFYILIHSFVLVRSKANR